MHEQELLAKKLLVKCEEKSAAQVDEWKEEKIAALKKELVPRRSTLQYQTHDRLHVCSALFSNDGSKSHALPWEFRFLDRMLTTRNCEAGRRALGVLARG